MKENGFKDIQGNALLNGVEEWAGTNRSDPSFGSNERDFAPPVLGVVFQPVVAKKRRGSRNRRLWLVPVVLLLGAVGFQMGTESTYFTSYAANAVFRNNFHAVVPGRLYRSAQMPRDELIDTIHKYGIRTVIDLRLNADTPDETGLTEAAAARQAGAAYRHIPFSSSRMDQRGSLLALMATYREAEGPILVHCSSGTHRAGVASAIWLLEQAGRSPTEAAEQLTLKYGFFQPERDLKAYLQGHPTLDRAIRDYAAVRREQGISFWDWVNSSVLFDGDQLVLPRRDCAEGLDRLATGRCREDRTDSR